MPVPKSISVSSLPIWAGLFCFVVALSVMSSAQAQDKEGSEFESMFNGENLLGWHVSENGDSVYVKDGCLVTHGPRAHAFFVGKTGQASYTDFHFKAKVMTEPKANSGIYFHTKYQEEGWPTVGYEAQVNNTHTDPRKTAGLYAIKDNLESPVKDNEWFDYEVIVEKKHIVIKINGTTITDYVEPDDVKRGEKMVGRVLNKGTIALQAHDPGSKVLFKELYIKAMP